MKFRYAILTACAGLCLFASPGFAFTVESAPTDAHGAALADPDEKFDDMSSPTKNGGQAMQFGDSSIWMGMSNSPSQQNTVQTGRQLFDPMGNFGNGH